MYAIGGWQEELSKKGAIFSLRVNFLWERQELSRNKNRRRMIKNFTNELIEMTKKKKKKKGVDVHMEFQTAFLISGIIYSFF